MAHAPPPPTVRLELRHGSARPVVYDVPGEEFGVKPGVEHDAGLRRPGFADQEHRRQRSELDSLPRLGTAEFGFGFLHQNGNVVGPSRLFGRRFGARRLLLLLFARDKQNRDRGGDQPNEHEGCPENEQLRAGDPE